MITSTYIRNKFIGISFIHDKGINYNLYEIKFIFIEFYIIFK